MTYHEFFDKIKNQFGNTDVSHINEHLAYQFNITGEAEGIFYAEVKDGKLYIEPYEYYDRDAIFIASAETFEKLLSGKTDPVFAFTTGKLKINGSIERALKLKDILKK